MGHNVCLLEVPSANPLSKTPRYSYMDYGMPNEPCENIQEVAEQIRKKYTKVPWPMTSPMAWFVSAGDLTPQLGHMG